MTSLGDSPEAFVVEEVLVVEKGDVVESVVAGFFVVELSADAVVLSAKVENGLFVVVFESFFVAASAAVVVCSAVVCAAVVWAAVVAAGAVVNACWVVITGAAD